MFRPTNVFPAPGTPVTKQIDFKWSLSYRAMTFEMASDVEVKLIALASLREIAFAECPLYNAWAASTMVGVGEYRPIRQLSGFSSGSFLANRRRWPFPLQVSQR